MGFSMILNSLMKGDVLTLATAVVIGGALVRLLVQQ
jgi:large-conductance mechanosensitive channel